MNLDPESNALTISFVVLVSAAFSFLLSGMETGVLALSPLRIRQLDRAGNGRARALHRYMEDPENFLLTILVGNTITNFAVFTLSAAILYHWLARWPVLCLLAFLAVAFLFYTLCELLPKTLFRMFPNRLCLLLVGPFRLLHLVLSPLVGLVGGFSRGLLRWTGGKAFTGRLFGTRDELRYVMQESSHGLTSDERAMINRVLDLQSRTVGQVLVPLENVISVSADTPLQEVFAICRERNLTRLPVWKQEGAHRHILGLISLKTLLYMEHPGPEKRAGDVLTPALYLPEPTRLEDALRQMQRNRRRLAVVLGRDQRELGIVSLEDILKTIFGEVNL